MADLQGQIGEVEMTIQITRAATGKVEEYKLVGHAVLDDEETNEVDVNSSEQED